VTRFFETLFYRPKWYHWAVALPLLPVSLLYGAGMWLRRRVVRRKQYPVPIISVGNLVIGGSGKTPFVIALADYFSERRVTIVSRGYGRQSRGVVEVSRRGEILAGVQESGDEPMLMAGALPHASVIVAEDRSAGIALAIRQGVELLLLDDGFNRVEIEKFEILLEPAVLPNRLPLPSGPMREFSATRSQADMRLREGEDFIRCVYYEGLGERMILATAIADPKRLEPYIPEGVKYQIYKPDHALFSPEELWRLLEVHEADRILMTEKDLVKVTDKKLPLASMKLKLELNDSIITEIERWLQKRGKSESKT